MYDIKPVKRAYGTLPYDRSNAIGRVRPCTPSLAIAMLTWARRRNVPKFEVILGLIDRAGPIETGDDLASWVAASQGKRLGFAKRKS